MLAAPLYQPPIREFEHERITRQHAELRWPSDRQRRWRTTDKFSYILVDIARNFAGDGRRAARLERAYRTVPLTRPIR
jgi:hypothetical protein